MPSAELWARVSSVAAWSLDDLLDDLLYRLVDEFLDDLLFFDDLGDDLLDRHLLRHDLDDFLLDDLSLAAAGQSGKPNGARTGHKPGTQQPPSRNRPDFQLLLLELHTNRRLRVFPRQEPPCIPRANVPNGRMGRILTQSQAPATWIAPEVPVPVGASPDCRRQPPRPEDQAPAATTSARPPLEAYRASIA